jgi:hypothetical protein
MHKMVKTNKGLSTPSPYFAGTKLKSKSGWEVNLTLKWDGNGTDNYGFNAKSSPERYSFGEFKSFNRISYWTSSYVNNGDQYSGNSCGIYVDYCGIALTIKDGFGSAEEENAEVSIGNLGNGYNVRLIK